MILVDTNVLIDVLRREGEWSIWSAAQLAKARASGPVALSEVAFAELCAGFDTLSAAERFCELAGVDILAAPRTALHGAGQAFRAYRRRREGDTGVLPDFFIGAHAQAIGCPLLTRDVRRYRTYFPDVRLITP